MTHNTITLIGMPGAGKSSVGVLLAKQVGLNFVDTDLLIQVQVGKTLQEIMDEQGHNRLRSLEQEVLLGAPLDKMLVATGGSAVYSKPGMQRLQSAGPVVFISVPLPVLDSRIDNEDQRGIARSPGQSFADIYAERLPLYEKYADVTVAGDAGSVESIATMIARQLGY